MKVVDDSFLVWTVIMDLSKTMDKAKAYAYGFSHGHLYLVMFGMP